MSRRPGHITREGEPWYWALNRARVAVEQAERERDELVCKALANGLGVRGVAKALKIDKATVSRRYRASAGEQES